MMLYPHSRKRGGVSRGGARGEASPDADVAGVSPVLVQMRVGRAQSRQMRTGTSRVPAQMWLRSSQCLARKRRRSGRPTPAAVAERCANGQHRCDGAAEVQPEGVVHRDANEPSRGAAHPDGLRASEQASKPTDKPPNRQTAQGAVLGALGGAEGAQDCSVRTHDLAWQHARRANAAATTRSVRNSTPDARGRPTSRATWRERHTG